VLARLFALETTGIKLGLDNITQLCAALDHPERSFTSILVAGTNGKGSVTAMAHAALQAGRIRAARYTSPHLVDVTERFVIGDVPVARPQLEDAAAMVLDRADALVTSGQLPGPPTFFEATTAIAFELFRRARIDVAVVEVGLGGRFDATNVLTPAVTAITTIGMDHEEYLGRSLAAIAAEKAGIIKPQVPVIVGELPPDARAVIAAVAAEREAPLVEAAAHGRFDADVQDGRATLVVDTPEDRYGPLTLALRGEHQIGNALVTIRLLEAARAAGVWLSGTAIERGLTGVSWPARLELLTLADGQRILMDAAHNPDGARALARYLQRWHPERPALVVGVMHDKDVDGIIAPLLPAVSIVICTAAPISRALPPAALAARVRSAAGRAGNDVLTITVEPEPLAAVERALEAGGTVCVAGSIFLVGAVHEALERRAILR
jgi:dihydrofolate synthase/folylpolyglutamate synthase